MASLQKTNGVLKASAVKDFFGGDGVFKLSDYFANKPKTTGFTLPAAVGNDGAGMPIRLLDLIGATRRVCTVLKLNPITSLQEFLATLKSQTDTNGMVYDPSTGIIFMPQGLNPLVAHWNGTATLENGFSVIIDMQVTDPDAPTFYAFLENQPSPHNRMNLYVDEYNVGGGSEYFVNMYGGGSGGYTYDPMTWVPQATPQFGVRGVYAFVFEHSPSGRVRLLVYKNGALLAQLTDTLPLDWTFNNLTTFNVIVRTLRSNNPNPARFRKIAAVEILQCPLSHDAAIAATTGAHGTITTGIAHPGPL